MVRCTQGGVARGGTLGAWSWTHMMAHATRGQSPGSWPMQSYMTGRIMPGLVKPCLDWSILDWSILDLGPGQSWILDLVNPGSGQSWISDSWESMIKHDSH